MIGNIIIGVIGYGLAIMVFASAIYGAGSASIQQKIKARGGNVHRRVYGLIVFSVGLASATRWLTGL